MYCRLLQPQPISPVETMAIDEAILLSCSPEVPATLRFYTWFPPGLTIGYFQSLGEDIDREECDGKGIAVVRRLTGGRAVLHQFELTYSLIASEDAPFVCQDVQATYERISQGLVLGLGLLGVEAQLGGGSTGEGDLRCNGSAACFDAPSQGEVVVDGRKMVGSAQTRRGGVLLQHGSILLKLDAPAYVDLLRLPPAMDKETLTRRIVDQTVGLGEFLDPLPSIEVLSSSMAQGLATALNLDLRQGELSPQEDFLVRELIRTKYSREEWNARR